MTTTFKDDNGDRQEQNPPMIQRIQALYEDLDAESIEAGALRELYAPDIVFVDPLHRFEGLPTLERYMHGLYRNAHKVSFRYLSTWEREDEAMLRWEMDFSHPRLRRGATITVPGVTYVRFTDRIHRHRDYFDSTEMIFDHVPVLGRILGWLKHRLNQS